MPSEAFKFTKTALNNLKPPLPGKRVYYRDSEQKGLILQHTGTGRLTFYLYSWVQGKPERMRLGDWPQLTVEMARDEARGKLPSLPN